MNQSVRNPFGEPDVPDPHDIEVAAFAEAATLAGGADDVNAPPWNRNVEARIDGRWPNGRLDFRR